MDATAAFWPQTPIFRPKIPVQHQNTELTIKHQIIRTILNIIQQDFAKKRNQDQQRKQEQLQCLALVVPIHVQFMETFEYPIINVFFKEIGGMMTNYGILA